MCQDPALVSGWKGVFPEDELFSPHEELVLVPSIFFLPSELLSVFFFKKIEVLG